jgi:hypothetical protein
MRELAKPFPPPTFGCESLSANCVRKGVL